MKFSQNESDDPLIIDGYEIYVDGDTLFQIEIKTESKRSIKKVSLDRYVTKAKRLPSS